MDRDDFFLFGTLIKTHGINGEFLTRFHVDYPEDFKELESVFIEIDEQLVPFFFRKNGMRFTAHLSAIVGFDDIASEEKGREFSGCDLYLPNEIQPDDSTNLKLEDIVGYMLKDATHGDIGKISEVFKFPNNPVIQIFRNEREILIPFSDEIILSIDHENQRIEMTIPDGLLDVYME